MKKTSLDYWLLALAIFLCYCSVLWQERINRESRTAKKHKASDID